MRTSVFAKTGSFLILLAGLMGATSCSKKNDTAPGEKIIYQTDFDQPDGFFYVGEDATGAGAMQNGIYTMTNKQTQFVSFFYTSSLFAGINGNTAIEAKVKPGAGTYGGLRWNDNASANGVNARTFEVKDNGVFIVGKYGADGAYVGISGSTLSAAIVKGDFNVLRVEERDGTMHFLINGTEVYSMPANGDKLDVCGFLVSASTTLQADYFRAIQLP
ncbi:hypothetical protein [Taibaiella koreensis]|uniref:hypothetical protein n=1 Tax=Taibaiella koreensis TaxID=1268548 RepID=UPI000E59C6C8|nr:hypothetical protein [Taibaiella koreensis]